MDVFVFRSPEETTELVVKSKQPVMDNKFNKKAKVDVIIVTLACSSMNTNVR